MKQGTCPAEQLSLSLFGSEPDSCAAEQDIRVPVRSGRRSRRLRNSPDLLQCSHCGKAVAVPEWFTSVRMALHFCGSGCRRLWIEQDPSLDVDLDSGRRSRRRGANWDIQARLARERDGFRCQTCGVTEEELGHRLDVHHHIPYCRFHTNVEANKVENLISVCPGCHGQLEAGLRTDLPLFSIRK